MKMFIGNGVYFEGTPKEMIQLQKLMSKEDASPEGQLNNLIHNIMERGNDNGKSND